MECSNPLFAEEIDDSAIVTFLNAVPPELRRRLLQQTPAPARDGVCPRLVRSACCNDSAFRVILVYNLPCLPKPGQCVGRGTL